MKPKLARLVEFYETQAGAFREQIRRLAAEGGDADMAADVHTLEADVRKLRQEAERPGVCQEQPSRAALING